MFTRLQLMYLAMAQVERNACPLEESGKPTCDHISCATRRSVLELVRAYLTGEEKPNE